jgi:hypothetical protein
VLNKITPEKFDRLMEQLLVRTQCDVSALAADSPSLLQELGIETAEQLKEVISLIFDKARLSISVPCVRALKPPQAIWEPTFCPLYAEMCVSLSKALPDFPPLEGEDKPLSFKRVLLNTCQARPRSRSPVDALTSPPLAVRVPGRRGGPRRAGEYRGPVRARGCGAQGEAAHDGQHPADRRAVQDQDAHGEDPAEARPSR